MLEELGVAEEVDAVVAGTALAEAVMVTMDGLELDEVSI